MPDWVIWVVLGYLFFRLQRRRRASYRSRHGASAFPSCGGSARLRNDRHSVVTAQRRQVLAAESPLEVLKRKYVEGSITVEQYEHELDRLFRGGAASTDGHVRASSF